jgi:hypothetical protein
MMMDENDYQCTLRIRGGAPVDMGLSDDQDGATTKPSDRFSYK